MLYAAIRKYSIIPRFVVEVMQRITEDFLPIISQEPDYLAYYAMRIGDNEVITISIFDTLAGAEGRTPLPVNGFKRILTGSFKGFQRCKWAGCSLARLEQSRDEELQGR